MPNNQVANYPIASLISLPLWPRIH